MNGERAKLIIKLILGIAAIAVCCLFIIFRDAGVFCW